MSTPAPTLPSADRQPGHVWPAIFGFAITRLLGNLFIRFPYVFITQISRGLGVQVETLTLILGARELGGLVAPLTGRWVDRGHTARVIVAGGVIAGTACMAAATTNVAAFVVIMVIGGAAKISIDLAQNAWLGHNVAIHTRGRVLWVVEATWALAFLAGVPAIAWLINLFGWRAGFIVTGPLLVVAAIVSGLRLREGEDVVANDGPGLIDIIEPDASPTTLRRPSHRLKPAVWIFCAMQPLAQMLIFAVNGDWFSESLDLTVTAVGTATLLLGAAELIGAVITVWFTDRYGSIRCGMWGMGLAIPPLLAITVVGHNAAAAIALLFVMDIAIEFGFVAVLPVFSELDPANRGKAVSQVFVIMMVTRAVGSGAAGFIYSMGGFSASVVAASIACAGAVAALGWCHLDDRRLAAA